MTALLKVDHLEVDFRTEEGVLRAVDDVSFELERGELLGIVGESGSGKSVTAMTLMGLTRGPNASFSGRAMLGDLDLVTASERQLESVRGGRVAMIFQDPMTALNPVQRVGDQIVEQIRAHQSKSRRAAVDLAVDLLDRVGIPRAKDRARSYPHEFSGGMRQRVMIAMALSCAPEILIADEPTTALDVTTQAQILAEIGTLRKELGVGVLLITHDLGVIADVADRVIVMYAAAGGRAGQPLRHLLRPSAPVHLGVARVGPALGRGPPEALADHSRAPPSLLRPPAGCRFAPRCAWRFEACSRPPPLKSDNPDSDDHIGRCWLELDVARERRLVGGTLGLPVEDVTGASGGAARS